LRALSAVLCPEEAVELRECTRHLHREVRFMSDMHKMWMSLPHVMQFAIQLCGLADALTPRLVSRGDGVPPDRRRCEEQHAIVLCELFFPGGAEGLEERCGPVRPVASAVAGSPVAQQRLVGLRAACVEPL